MPNLWRMLRFLKGRINMFLLWVLHEEAQLQECNCNSSIWYRILHSNLQTKCKLKLTSVKQSKIKSHCKLILILVRIGLLMKFHCLSPQMYYKLNCHHIWNTNFIMRFLFVLHGEYFMICSFFSKLATKFQKKNVCFSLGFFIAFNKY